MRGMNLQKPHDSAQAPRPPHPGPLPPEYRGEREGKALALSRPVAGKGSKIVACCAKAWRDGVRPGMPQAEALALLPSLRVEPEDLDADRAELLRWAAWAERFSPIVGIEEALEPATLFLDVTGGASCFGGEEALVHKVCEAFAAEKWDVRVALADTIGAGWALTHRTPLPSPSVLRGRGVGGEGAAANPLKVQDSARDSKPPSPQPSPPGVPWGEGEDRGISLQAAIIAPGEHPRHLASLPVALLRLGAAAVTLLHQLGIDRIETLAALPRAEVAQRFGTEVVRQLDRALGDVAEVIVPYHAQPETVACCAFDFGIDRHDVVARALDDLLVRLEAILERRGQGARLFECVLRQEDGESPRIECQLSRPMRDAKYIGQWLRVRFEQVRLTAPVMGIELRAVSAETLKPTCPDLFDGEAHDQAEALAHLLDQLTTQLGKDAVTTPMFIADPQPEFACRFASALHQPETPLKGMQANRPLRLYARPIAVDVIAVVPDGKPETLRHAGNVQAVTRCIGPERIETGWWRGDDIGRDYYIAETADGARWWLFRRIDTGRWFLHGCFE